MQKSLEPILMALKPCKPLHYASSALLCILWKFCLMLVWREMPDQGQHGTVEPRNSKIKEILEWSLIEFLVVHKQITRLLS